MQSLIDTLKSFNTVIMSKNPQNVLRDCMSYYYNNMAQFQHDFYTATIDSTDEIKACVQDILTNLNIPKLQWGRYLDSCLTVHDFLVELDGLTKNEKIREFIKLIDTQAELEREKIIFAGLTALLFLDISAVLLVASRGVTAFQELIAAAVFIPVVGVVYTAAVAIYSLYKNLSDKKIPWFDRFRDNFFLLANAALNFAAYGVLITAATTATPVTAVLFVLAAVVSVIQEVTSIVQMVIQDKTKATIVEPTDLDAQQKQARHELDYIKRRNSVLINIFTAVASASIVAAWCFVPGGIFVAVGAVVAIGVVYLAKSWAQKHNEAAIKARLQSKYEDLESMHHNKNNQALKQDREETPTNNGEPQPLKRPIADRPSLVSQCGLFATKGMQSPKLLDSDSIPLSDFIPPRPR